jgi:FAD/FMN-containing dehydrogenase
MSTAVPNRNARYFYSALARWNPPGAGTRPRNWLAGTGEALRALTVGGPNVGMRSAGMSSIEAYGAERYLRLAALKRRFDPDNVFAINQNVTPLV